MRDVEDADIIEKMGYVYRLALKSDDKSTRNGAVICREGWNIASGFNEVQREFKWDAASYERPRKYQVTEHAERACIFDAVCRNVDIRQATMVANWVACPDCARAIIRSGIAEVICHKACMDRTPPAWKEAVELGVEMMQKAGVVVRIWDGKVGGVGHMNGEVWFP